MEINHYWGNDLQVGPTGDLALVDTTSWGQQRVLRRLLTNPAQPIPGNPDQLAADYIWHPDYGAGLPGRVGGVVNLVKIKALIRTQILLEAAVAKQPEPVITVRAISGGVSVYIRYTDAVTQLPVVLGFDVNI